MTVDRTLVLPVKSVSYFEVVWSDFKKFAEQVYGLPDIKFPSYVITDVRAATYVITKQELEENWLDMLREFITTGEDIAGFMTDVVHLMLTDLCQNGLIEPGKYRFVDVYRL